MIQLWWNSRLNTINIVGTVLIVTTPWSAWIAFDPSVGTVWRGDAEAMVEKISKRKSCVQCASIWIGKKIRTGKKICVAIFYFEWINRLFWNFLTSKLMRKTNVLGIREVVSVDSNWNFLLYHVEITFMLQKKWS